MDPALKFVVDIQNSEAIKKLTADINQQKDSIAALNSQLVQGAINDKQFAAAALPLGQNIATATTHLNQLQAATGNAGRGLSQLSYAVDDIQYGFNAIVNNIPQIVLGLGGSAGIAGAVGIAAVAINQLMKHWSELGSYLQSAWEGGSAERLQILADRAAAAAKAFEKLKEVGTPNEQKGATEFGGAVTEAGTEKIRKAITDTLIATGGAADKRAIQPGGHVPDPLVEYFTGHKTPHDAAQQIAIQYEDTARKAGELIGQAQQPGEAGRVARDRIANLIKKNPKAFDEEFRTRFEASDPDKQREIEQKRLDLAGGRLGRKQEEKAADKDSKLVDKLNQAGQENQRLAEEDRRNDRIKDLQDRRDKIMDQKHAISEQGYQAKHGARQTEILGDAKAVNDFYQKATGDKMADLTKRTHVLLEAQNKTLKLIEADLKKERAVKLPK